MTHLLHNILLTTPFNFYNLLHYNYSLLKVVKPQLLQQLLIEFLRVQLPVNFKDVYISSMIFIKQFFAEQILFQLFTSFRLYLNKYIF